MSPYSDFGFPLSLPQPFFFVRQMFLHTFEPLSKKSWFSHVAFRTAAATGTARQKKLLPTLPTRDPPPVALIPHTPLLRTSRPPLEMRILHQHSDSEPSPAQLKPNRLYYPR